MKIQAKTQGKAGKTSSKNPKKTQKITKNSSGEFEAKKPPSKKTSATKIAKKPEKRATENKAVKKTQKPLSKSVAKKPVNKPVAVAKKKPTQKSSAVIEVKKQPLANPMADIKNKVNKTSKVLSTTPAQTDKNKIEEKVERKVEKKTSVVQMTTIGPLNLPPFIEGKDEEYMSKRQLDYFLEVLNTWRDQLHAERNATVQHMQEDPINFPDLLDRAALEEEHKLEWQTREREHKLIIKIEKAVARIKQGDYGYCEKCGSEIGLLRLQVRPTATLCVDCKAIDEIREKQTGLID